MDKDEIVKSAIKACGNPHRLALRLGVKPPSVYQWIRKTGTRKHPSGKHLMDMLRIAQEATKKGIGGAAAVLLAIALGAAYSGDAGATDQGGQKCDRSTHYTKNGLLASLAHLLRRWTHGPFTALAL